MADFAHLAAVSQDSRDPNAVIGFDPEEEERRMKTLRRKEKAKEIMANEANAFESLKIGMRVSVDGYDGLGTVRFLGEHHEHQRLRVGIEFDAKIGKNNGTIDSHTYFSCAPKHGLLTPPSKVTLAAGEVVYGGVGEEETFGGFEEGADSGASAVPLYAAPHKVGAAGASAPNSPQVDLLTNPDYEPLSDDMALYDNPEAGSVDEVSEELYGATSASLGLKSVRVRESFSLDKKDGDFRTTPAYLAHSKACDAFLEQLQADWDTIIQLNPKTPKEASKAKSTFSTVKSSHSKKRKMLEALRSKAQALDKISFDARQDGLEKVLMLQTAMGKFSDMLESAGPIIQDHVTREKHKVSVLSNVKKLETAAQDLEKWTAVARGVSDENVDTLNEAALDALLLKVDKLRKEHPETLERARELIDLTTSVRDSQYHSEHSHWQYDEIDDLKALIAKSVEAVEDVGTDLEVAEIDFEDKIVELEHAAVEARALKEEKKGTSSNSSMQAIFAKHAAWAEREAKRVAPLLEPIASLSAGKKLATRFAKITAATSGRLRTIHTMETKDVKNESVAVAKAEQEHAVLTLNALSAALAKAAPVLNDNIKLLEFVAKVTKQIERHAADARALDSWCRGALAFCAKPHQIGMPAQGTKLLTRLEALRLSVADHVDTMTEIKQRGVKIAESRYESELSTWQCDRENEVRAAEQDADEHLAELPSRLDAKEIEIHGLIEQATQRLQELQHEEKVAREAKEERAHAARLQKYLKWATPLAQAFEKVKIVSVSSAKKALTKHKKLLVTIGKKEVEVKVLAVHTNEMAQELQDGCVQIQIAIGEAFDAARARLDEVKPMLDDHLAREQYAAQITNQGKKYRSAFGHLKKWTNSCNAALNKERKKATSKQVHKMRKTVASYAKKLKQKNKKLADVTAQLDALEKSSYESDLSTWRYKAADALREPLDVLTAEIEGFPARLSSKDDALLVQYNTAAAEELRLKQEKEARKAAKAAAKRV
mmetsp:Transcript_5058/g.15400  ORF Transcript_5058/g.15400 Transcript_5058/m.15400 type:complete len:998 (-) Transcript_5058:98-3091(-)|eukprot:CAMPEP_0206292272 /NCGR_PEP_ID=MMETSP0106_2-20121207/3543_1 /ASSEMBLY_ACC=CAM_ASM_000206 /TAXON_ID=81532 /ORGANISM="Acanthoeca-like sp., Strain 10tr" /LENGTH=997 /DNA_ID=CAMNT_0053722845 /DNA_START=167 /DNA_END=3156 /DNA_ORIENTATION=-